MFSHRDVDKQQLDLVSRSPLGQKVVGHRRLEEPMALVTRFDTPGRLRDLPASSPFYDGWHREVSELLAEVSSAALLQAFEPPPPGSGFYNASLTEVNVVGARALVWMGFPRQLLVADHPGGRREAFSKGDARGVSIPGGRQPRLSIWSGSRSATSAGESPRSPSRPRPPSTGTALFQSPGGPDRVLELYRELLGNSRDLSSGDHRRFRQLRPAERVEYRARDHSLHR